MGVSFDFKMEFPNLHEKLKKAVPEIQLFIAAQMQFNRAMLFTNSGAYNGHEKWKDLKCREGQPLKDRGTLSQSLGPINNESSQRPTKSTGSIVRISTGMVSIGTSLHYAPMMNWGTTGLPDGVLRPKTKKVLAFKCGDQMIFRKSVKIPARRFDNWSRQDERDIKEALRMKVMQVMKR